MSDKTAARLIDAVIASLRRNVVPSLGDGAAAIHADLITRVLWLVSFRLSAQEQQTGQLLAGKADLLQKIESLLGSDGESSVQTDSIAVESRLRDLTPALLRSASTSADARSLLDRLISLERDFLVAQDPDIVGGSAVVFRGGRIESDRGVPAALVESTPDSKTLERYLQTAWSDSAIAAQSVRAIPGGFSKATIFFDVLRGGDSEALVMRKDMTLPFMEKTVRDEFPLLKRLHAVGFPVAEPLWLEADSAALGSAFMISRRVAGTCDFRSWASDPTAVQGFARELAAIMARLHRLDLSELGYGPAETRKSAGAQMLEELDRWSQLFAAKRSKPHPLIDITLTWLRQNVPKESFDRPGRVVHGDIGFHNLMFDEGRVTALLDWEFSHLGDPLEDLVYTRIFIEQIMAWQDFKRFYVEAGGMACSPEVELFYGIWSRVRNAIGCIDAAHLFDHHLPDEIKFAVSGHVFGLYLELEAGEMLASALAVSTGRQ